MGDLSEVWKLQEAVLLLIDSRRDAAVLAQLGGDWMLDNS